jgi:hypothetical protein
VELVKDIPARIYPIPTKDNEKGEPMEFLTFDDQASLSDV